MVPTPGRAPVRLLSKGGARFVGGDEIGDLFEQLGLVRVRTKSVGTIQWVRGQKP